jgi:O-antigen biosynthesis protein
MGNTFWSIIKASIRTIRKDGVTSFTKQALEKARNRDWHVSLEPEYAEAALLARTYDFEEQDIRLSKAVHEQNSGPLALKEINWFIPPFDNPYWGGIHTILRFADYFRIKKQIKNRIVIIGLRAREEQRQRERLARVFPDFSDQTYSIRSYDELDEIPSADAIVCSLWTTAYFALRFNRTKRKFYFIQDFEPLFYPAGSIYAQAETTYRFGFYGIANTEVLANAFRRYGGISDYFNPCVDTDIFHRNADPNPQRPFTIFFYGRPNHPRNCFELGTQALKLVKKKLGTQVRIVSAGSDWESEDYGLQGVVEQLGLLDYHETAKLFRECDVGLSMMVTMHPSYIPMQLMASGCVAITNRNPHTTWLLKGGENCILCEPSASSISDAILQAYNDPRLRSRLAENASYMIERRYSNWNTEMEKTFRFMTHP